MRLRKQDSQGDMCFGYGANDIYNNQAEGVAQLVGTRLNLWTGEWFGDVTEGTPWNNRVLGEHTRRAYDAVLRRRILETEGVESILQFQSTLGSNRKLTVSTTLNTIYGTASTIVQPNRF